MSRVIATLALAGLVLGPVRADDADDRAEKVVKKYRGLPSRDDKLPGKPIVGINLMAAKVTDEDMKGFAGLKSITTLHLESTKITDAGLKEIAGLKSLTTL